jgi:hypothetical protein
MIGVQDSCLCIREDAQTLGGHIPYLASLNPNHGGLGWGGGQWPRDLCISLRVLSLWLGFILDVHPIRKKLKHHRKMNN